MRFAPALSALSVAVLGFNTVGSQADASHMRGDTIDVAFGFEDAAKANGGGDEPVVPLDGNNDEEVTLKEALDFVKAKLNLDLTHNGDAQLVRDMLELFKKHDADGSKVLNRGEAESFAHALSTEWLRIETEALLEDAFLAADRNSDGVVDFGELIKIFSGNGRVSRDWEAMKPETVAGVDARVARANRRVSKEKVFAHLGMPQSKEDAIHEANLFKMGVPRVSAEVSAQILEAQYKVCDSNGDGYMQESEYFRLRHPMHPDQVLGEAMRLTFHVYDTDADGKLSTEEFKNGFKIPDATPFVNGLDRDKDGFVQKSEFQVFLYPFSGRMEGQMKLVLDDLDQNGDGRITREEAANMHSANREKRPLQTHFGNVREHHDL